MSSITQASITIPAAPAAQARSSGTRPSNAGNSQIQNTDTTTQVSVSDSARLLARAEGTDAKDANADSDTETAAPVQSFVYGALGLDRPEEQAKAENGYYSAGKWLAAAATVGTMVSLLI